MNRAQGGQSTDQRFLVSGSWVTPLTQLSLACLSQFSYSTSSSAHISLVTTLHQFFMGPLSITFLPFFSSPAAKNFHWHLNLHLAPSQTRLQHPALGSSTPTLQADARSLNVLEPHLFCMHLHITFTSRTDCTPSVDRHLLPLTGSPARAPSWPLIRTVNGCEPSKESQYSASIALSPLR